MIFEVKFPILGFEGVKEVKLEKIDKLFLKITNSKEPTPSFTLVNPFLLREYEFEIPIYVKSLLSLKPDSDILIANIMIVATPIEESTVNFIAPMIFNFDNSTMAQIVLDSTKYPDFGISESIKEYIDKK